MRTAEEARASVARAKGGLAVFAEEILRQIEEQDWVPLGYATWDEMREAEYEGPAAILPRAARPAVTARMRALGLSQQSIAATLGVSLRTVKADSSKCSPALSGEATVTNARGQQRPTTYAPRGQQRPTLEEVEASVSAVRASLLSTLHGIHEFGFDAVVGDSPPEQRALVVPILILMLDKEAECNAYMLALLRQEEIRAFSEIVLDQWDNMTLEEMKAEIERVFSLPEKKRFVMNQFYPFVAGEISVEEFAEAFQ